jgi:hypothetical protein
MKKYNDDSTMEKEWSIKKLIKTYHYYFFQVNSDKKVSIIDSYNFECMKNELMRRGYEIIERLPVIKKSCK